MYQWLPLPEHSPCIGTNSRWRKLFITQWPWRSILALMLFQLWSPCPLPWHQILYPLLWHQSLLGLLENLLNLLWLGMDLQGKLLLCLWPQHLPPVISMHSMSTAELRAAIEEAKRHEGFASFKVVEEFRESTWCTTDPVDELAYFYHTMGFAPVDTPMEGARPPVEARVLESVQNGWPATPGKACKPEPPKNPVDVEFEKLCGENLMPLMERLKKMDDLEAKNKIKAIQVHSSFPAFSEYIHKISGEYIFGTGEVLEDIASFELWCQAEEKCNSHRPPSVLLGQSWHVQPHWTWPIQPKRLLQWLQLPVLQQCRLPHQRLQRQHLRCRRRRKSNPQIIKQNCMLVSSKSSLGCEAKGNESKEGTMASFDEKYLGFKCGRPRSLCTS